MIHVSNYHKLCYYAAHILPYLFSIKKTLACSVGHARKRVWECFCLYDVPCLRVPYTADPWPIFPNVILKRTVSKFRFLVWYKRVFCCWCELFFIDHPDRIHRLMTLTHKAKTQRSVLVTTDARGRKTHQKSG